MGTGVVHPFNPAKLLFHRDKVELAARGDWTRGPIGVEWDLSNTCSHSCAFCSFGTTESHGYRQQAWQHFPTTRALSLIPELAAAGVESVTFTGGGEPLNHPHAALILSNTHEAGIQFGLVTNGQLLHGPAFVTLAEHARFIRVSWDAGTAETHQLMHRTRMLQLDDIERAMADLIHAAKRRPDPLVVGASFCVTDTNCHELPRAAARLLAIGADYLEVRPTYPTTWRGDGWEATLTKQADALAAMATAKELTAGTRLRVIGMVDRFASLEGYRKGYDKCSIGPLTTVIAATGDLYHCCVQRGQAPFVLASVLDQSFDAAWLEARDRNLRERIEVHSCPRCRYDSYNEILAGLPADAFHAAFV